MKEQSFPTLIVTNRLELRQHRRGLASEMFACVDRDRERLREFLPWVDMTKTVADEESYIQMTLDRWHKGELFDYGLFLKTEGRYLGNVGLHTIAWNNRCAEIGYWILGEFEGQGYISEAVTGLQEAAFALGFHRLEIRCSSENHRSASVPRRLGYKLDGTLRENSIEHGLFRDTLVFSKLSGE